MINITECRIGNLVTNRGKNEIVTGILAGKIYTRPVGSISTQMNNPYSPDELSPIEITEALLKDNTKIVGGEYVFRLSEKNDLLYNSGDCRWYIEEDIGYDILTQSINIQIKYIHLLQNLYFALAGKELPIKL